MHRKNKLLQSAKAGVSLSFHLDGRKSAPLYEVRFSEQPVINPSRMGFRLANGESLETGFVLTGSEKKTVDETWQPVWGEVKEIHNQYEQLLVHLRQKDAPGRCWTSAFRCTMTG